MLINVATPALVSPLSRVEKGDVVDNGTSTCVAAGVKNRCAALVVR
ncbi:MAG: hypothetical protein JWM55_1034 [Acidimicrobiaceae bacterium]|nr:hypothetical protein [Acidimicrobiaceae bacterium]